MADAKQRGHWLGHPVLSKEHEHELHLQSAIHEFQGGVPREEAEKRALVEYRQEHHARAAAHHLGGIKASMAIGNPEDAEKHHSLYSLHCKALGHDPLGPVPDVVLKHHQGAGKDEKQKRVYGFKGHDADEFLVQPVTKAERDLYGIELLKHEGGVVPAQDRAEALARAADIVRGREQSPTRTGLVRYLDGLVGYVAPPAAARPLAQPAPTPLQKACRDLSSTLNVLALAKSAIELAKGDVVQFPGMKKPDEPPRPAGEAAPVETLDSARFHRHQQQRANESIALDEKAQANHNRLLQQSATQRAQTIAAMHAGKATQEQVNALGPGDVWKYLVSIGLPHPDSFRGVSGKNPYYLHQVVQNIRAGKPGWVDALVDNFRTQGGIKDFGVQHLPPSLRMVSVPQK